jgi:hypothetical protein
LHATNSGILKRFGGMWDRIGFEHGDGMGEPHPLGTECLDALRRSLHLPAAGGALPNELHFALEPQVDVGVVCGADRVAMLSELAPVSALSLTGVLDALEEAATWGLAGESLRLVVLEQMLALLWTVPLPQEPQGFVIQATEVLARVVKLANSLSWRASEDSGRSY